MPTSLAFCSISWESITCRRRSKTETGSFADALFSAAVGKHDLGGLVQVATPIGPLVAARAQNPEIANPIFVDDRHYGLPVLERDVGFTSRHIEGNSEQIVGLGILEQPLIIILERFNLVREIARAIYEKFAEGIEVRQSR